MDIIIAHDQTAFIMTPMTAYQNIFIIHNPVSTGPSQSAAERLQRQLSRHLKPNTVKLMPTAYAGHAEELAYQATKKNGKKLIISVSGDGGYHEVINGIMRAKLAGYDADCAVLAAGNANDHRQAVGSSPVIESIINSEQLELDLLKVTIRSGQEQVVRYGHSYMGAGLTPVIATELNRHSLNAVKELWIVLRGFYKFRPFQIETEDKLLTLDSLIMTNIHRMAKVLTFKDARPTDGKFEIVTFEHSPKLKLLWKLSQAVFTGLRPSHTASRYIFISKQPMPIQIDAEVTALKAGDQVDVELVAGALTTYS